MQRSTFIRNLLGLVLPNFFSLWALEIGIACCLHVVTTSTKKQFFWIILIRAVATCEDKGVMSLVVFLGH